VLATSDLVSVNAADSASTIVKLPLRIQLMAAGWLRHLAGPLGAVSRCHVRACLRSGQLRGRQPALSGVNRPMSEYSQPPSAGQGSQHPSGHDPLPAATETDTHLLDRLAIIYRYRPGRVRCLRADDDRDDDFKATRIFRITRRTRGC